MNDKLHLTWNDVYDQSLKLADSIKDSGLEFDYIIVVPRGGYFVANIVTRELGYESIKLLHACVGSYADGENNKQENLVVGEMPPAEKVAGSKLLIIDEVCDTGDTLEYVSDYLIQAGADQVGSAVLHYKPANSLHGYKPDFYVDQTDQWIVYPWEAREYK